MLRTLLIILLIYLGYRFIVYFLLPVIKVSQQMKQQVRNFKQHMEEQPSSHQPGSGNPPQAPKEEVKTGEYIDFEEIK